MTLIDLLCDQNVLKYFFSDFREEATHVRLGDFNYGSERDDSKPLNVRIDAVILHPKYTRKSLYDNIALVRLDQSVDFNSHIRPACLPQMFETVGETVSMTGWPFKLYSVPKSLRYKQDMTLRKYNMNSIDFEECQRIFAPHSVKGMSQGFSDTQTCASIRMEDDRRHFKILRPLEVNDNFILMNESMKLLREKSNCVKKSIFEFQKFIVIHRCSTVRHYKHYRIVTTACIQFWDFLISSQHSD